MEVIYYQSILLSIFVVSLLQLLKQWRLRWRRPGPRLPPGPWKLPMIGSMHHLVNKLPHRALKALADVHGPLMMLQLGETPLVVVSSKETARQVLKNHDNNFATRPKLMAGEIVGYDWADILFSPSGDYWRKLRQLCAVEILSPKRILSFRHIRDEEVLSCMEKIRAAGSAPINLTLMFHGMTNSIIARAAFGKKRKRAAEFMVAIKRGVGLSSGFNIPDLFPTWTPVLAVLTGMKRRLLEIHETVDTILQDIIDERRAARAEKLMKISNDNNIIGDDDKYGTADDHENLVDALLGLQEKGGFGFELHDDRIKAVILDMFAGGTGTSASALEWTMSELMRNPKVLAKLQKEIREAFCGKPAAITESDLAASNLKYLKLVIKEALRLHPPAPLLVPRESIESCEIDGYVVPAKARVVVNAWAISRDPKYWDDPEEFRPERFEQGGIDFTGGSFEFMPFGAGRRMCPGYNYGLASMELALAQLLHAFDWALPPGGSGEVDMTEAPGLGVRRSTPLMLCATPFVPSPADG